MKGMRSWGAGLAVLLAVAAWHAWSVSGAYGVFWGDAGQVLHQLDAFAHGGVPYRNFLLTSPPLGIWVVGAVTRLWGADLPVVGAATTVLFLGVVALWWPYVRRAAGPELALPVALVALVLGAAMAPKLGNALPLGSYSLGAPVGFAALLGALLALDRWNARGGRLAPLVLGASAGACILAKQDVWPPALVVVGLGGLLAVRARDLRAGLAMAAGFAGVTGAGLAAIAWGSGAASVLPAMTGYGVAEDSGIGRLLPSWELLTLDVMALLLFALGVLLALRLGGAAPRRLRSLTAAGLVALALAVGLHFFMTARVDARVQAKGLQPWPTNLEMAVNTRHRRNHGAGVSLARVEREVLVRQLARRPLATLLPVAATLVLLLGWRRADPVLRRRALVLLLVCLALRARRGFELTEWTHAMLELPAYAATARALLGDAALRPVRLGLVGVALVGCFLYWRNAPGALTHAGRRPPHETVRGTVRWAPRQVADLDWLQGVLDARDPARVRPVFTFGHSGGAAYFLGRPHPSPVTYGLKVSVIPPEEAVRQVRAADPPYFLVYHPAYENLGVPVSELHFDSWEHRLRPNVMIAHDPPYFAQMREGCPEVARHPAEGRPFFHVYDCPPRVARPPAVTPPPPPPAVPRTGAR